MKYTKLPVTLQRYARTSEPFQLTFTQYLVLLTLWDEDHLLAKDIGDRLELGIGTLNPIITRMIDRGWLDKRQSEKDKRSFIISLTEKAKNEEKLIEKAIIQKIINCNFLELNAETLMSNLKDLNSFLGQID